MSLKKTRWWIWLVAVFVWLGVIAVFATFRTWGLAVAIGFFLPILFIAVSRFTSPVPAAPIPSDPPPTESHKPHTRTSVVGCLVVLAAMVGVLSMLYLDRAPFLSSHSLPPRDRIQLACKTYRLRLNFDPANNTFSGESILQIEGEIEDYDDKLHRVMPGTPILPSPIFLRSFQGGELLKKFADLGLEGWYVMAANFREKPNSSDLLLAEPDIRPRSAIFSTVLRNSHVEVQRTRSGLLRYVATVRSPAILFERGDAEPRVEVTILSPANSHFSHNLNGTSSQTVLENNQIGRSVVADRIIDASNTVRLSFPPAFCQNEIIHNVTEFSWWTLIVAIGSLILMTIGYFLSAVSDVVKDDVIKPPARKVLSMIGLIKREDKKHDT